MKIKNRFPFLNHNFGALDPSAESRMPKCNFTTRLKITLTLKLIKG